MSAHQVGGRRGLLREPLPHHLGERRRVLPIVDDGQGERGGLTRDTGRDGLGHFVPDQPQRRALGAAGEHRRSHGVRVGDGADRRGVPVQRRVQGRLRRWGARLERRPVETDQQHVALRQRSLVDAGRGDHQAPG
jgi:hypothetical protein